MRLRYFGSRAAFFVNNLSISFTSLFHQSHPLTFLCHPSLSQQQLTIVLELQLAPRTMTLFLRINPTIPTSPPISEKGWSQQ